MDFQKVIQKYQEGCETLRLIQMQISYQQIPIILKAIQPILPDLRKLSLRQNNIGPEGARLLGAAHFVELSLDLNHNRVGASGAKYLSNSSTVLTQLNLGKNVSYSCNNDIGNEGVKHICNGNLDQLSSLSLNGNMISDKGLTYIKLGNFKNLHRLSLRSNNIWIEGAKNLLDQRFKSTYILFNRNRVFFRFAVQFRILIKKSDLSKFNL